VSSIDPSEEQLALSAAGGNEIARQALEILSETGATGGLTANAALNQAQGKVIAKAIASGKVPAKLNLLRIAPQAVSAAIAELAENYPDFNLSQATLEYDSTQRWLSTMNSATYQRSIESIGFILGNGTPDFPGALQTLKDLSDEWNTVAGNSGWQIINRLRQGAQVQLGAEEGAIAQNLIGHVNELVSSLATIYRGGAAPTDKAIDLAREQLSSTWSPEVMQKSIETLETSLQHRINAIINLQPITSPGDIPSFQGETNTDNDPLARFFEGLQ
jgi:hypothetical protein